jgi:hypothetical protein
MYTSASNLHAGIMPIFCKKYPLFIRAKEAGPAGRIFNLLLDSLSGLQS